MADHQEFLDLAREMLADDGRSVTFGKLAGAPDPAKPWKGSGEPTLVAQVTTFAVFLPVSSLTELGFNAKDMELLKEFSEVLMVAPPVTGENLLDFHVIVDGAVRWKIKTVKALKPANLTVLYAMGVAR